MQKPIKKSNLYICILYITTIIIIIIIIYVIY